MFSLAFRCNSLHIVTVSVLRKCSRKIRSLLTAKLNHSVYANKYADVVRKIIAVQRVRV